MKFDYRAACIILFFSLAGICFLGAIIMLCEGAYTLAVACGIGASLLAAFATGCAGGEQ